MKVYLSGKITGDKNYRSKFFDMAERLSKIGFSVFNPAVLPDGFEYEDYMKIDIAALQTCDAIFLMDDWKYSPGAAREKEEADRLNLRVLTEKDIVCRETLLQLCNDCDKIFMDECENNDAAVYNHTLRRLAAFVRNAVTQFDDKKTEVENFLLMIQKLDENDRQFFYSDFIKEGDLQIEYDIEQEMTDWKKRKRFSDMICTVQHLRDIVLSVNDESELETA